MNFDVIVAFLKKAAYTAIGGLLAMVTLGMANYVPAGTPLDLQIFTALTAVLTGLVAAVKRWMEGTLETKNPVV